MNTNKPGSNLILTAGVSGRRIRHWKFLPHYSQDPQGVEISVYEASDGKLTEVCRSEILGITVTALDLHGLLALDRTCGELCVRFLDAHEVEAIQ